MARRKSGYSREDFELYPTPAWVVAALGEHVCLKGKTIWEPACGTGYMARALGEAGASVYATDIVDLGYAQQRRQIDFLSEENPRLFHYDGIVTNPPYGPRGKTAEAFIKRGLERTADYGFVAYLLPADFDHALTRAPLFEGCPAFAGKIILRKRIKWFDGPHSPSENHSWFLFSRTCLVRDQFPRIWYAPRAAAHNEERQHATRKAEREQDQDAV